MNLQNITAFLKYLATLVVRSYYYEQTDRLKVEYDAIYQHISKITQIMTGWRTVAISAAIALPSLAKYVELSTSKKEFYWPFGIFGFVILTLWLIIDSYFDWKIFNYYSRIQKLEAQLNIHVYHDLKDGVEWNLYKSLFKRGRFLNLLLIVFYVVVCLILALWEF